MKKIPLRKIMCDYFLCEDEICEEDKKIEQGMKFCQKHHDELHSYLTAEPFNPAKVLGFWVKSNGGAKKLTKKLIGDN